VVGFGNNTGNIFSEEFNDLNGFLVFLEGLDEHEVSITSLFSKSFSLLLDIGSSVVDPSKILSGDLDLILDVFSVGGGGVTGGLIRVGNAGKILDEFTVLLFNGGVVLISELLGIEVGLLKVSEESES
jgi:hypothetical protein